MSEKIVRLKMHLESAGRAAKANGDAYNDEKAENAQLRHALANAQVAAGFAKEMTEKVKGMQEEIDTLTRDVADAMQLGFVRGMERSAEIAGESCEDCASDILAEVTRIHP